MKKLIFLIIFLYSTVFSYDGVISKEDKIWRQKLSTLGHDIIKEDWVQRVSVPSNCRIGLAMKLGEISMISLNILNKKPVDWLEGNNLRYINDNCLVMLPLRTSEIEFNKAVDAYINLVDKKDFTEKKQIKETSYEGAKFYFSMFFVLGLLWFSYVELAKIIVGKLKIK